MIEKLTCLVLTTSTVSVTILPELGGRIVELADLQRGRQWLWRNHRVPLGPVEPGDSYDEVWQGGFEELFPSDDETLLDSGVKYPDHGELWNQPWVVVASTNHSVELEITGTVTGVRVTKQIELKANEVRISYSFHNSGPEPLPYLFKLHAAIAVTDSCYLQLPGGMVEQVDPLFGNLMGSVQSAPWPVDGVDLSACRPQRSRTREFVYVSELPEGWCAVGDYTSGSMLRIRYPIQVFPYCWLFLTYGGWRGHNVAVLEPCTNYPKDLRSAMRSGTSAVLGAGGTQNVEVVMTVEAM